MNVTMVRQRLPERRLVDLELLLQEMVRGARSPAESPGAIVPDSGSAAVVATTDAPFAMERVEFCAGVSHDLLHDPECRRYPEVQALAFWMRPASLHRLSEDFIALAERRTVLAPRGLVFHIPPANVDTLFVYSWLLSFLVGNQNIVRLPGRVSPQVEAICRILEGRLASASLSIRLATVMLSYSHETEITAGISSQSDVRVIWGGDATVREIRTVPLPASARELTFPDRFSLSVVSAAAYLACDTQLKDDLAACFFNDAYWFDQMACSSPRLLVWCGGEQEAEQAGRTLFEGLQRVVEGRGYDPDTGALLNKFTFTHRAVLDLPVTRCRRYGNLVTVLTLESLAQVRRDHCGAGLFYEFRVGQLEDLADFFRRQDQTLTHFGFRRDELENLVRKVGPRGLDRLVPIGQALTFNRFWDGYDLLQEFTRRVWIDEG